VSRGRTSKPRLGLGGGALGGRRARFRPKRASPGVTSVPGSAPVESDAPRRGWGRWQGIALVHRVAAVEEGQPHFCRRLRHPERVCLHATPRSANEPFILEYEFPCIKILVIVALKRCAHYCHRHHFIQGSFYSGLQHIY
jgi:hypothetical protein